MHTIYFYFFHWHAEELLSNGDLATWGQCVRASAVPSGYAENV